MRASFALLVALALTPALSGCVLADDLIVAASAPKAASGMTLFLVANRGFVSRLSSAPSAEYVIYYGDQLVYPPAGKGGSFDVNGRTGTAFVPYDRFVVGNGEYDVLVRYNGAESRTRVHVDKWARFVYLHPYEKDGEVIVESALQSASGGDARDRILASGELVLTLKYRGKDGSGDLNVAQISVPTRNDQTSTYTEVARSRFDQGPGYYSFEPLFHNHEARGNLQVPPDPAMANSQPPLNWILIS